MMRDPTVRTSPRSYLQATQSTWSGPLETGRARDAGEHFADGDADTSKPDGFVVHRPCVFARTVDA